MDTKFLRQQIRQQRRTLGTAGQSVARRMLDKQLRRFSVAAGAQHIGLYLVNDGEIDPANFMHWAFTQGKHCYLPVLNSENDQAMKFAEVTPDSNFKPNRFGIPEPMVTEPELIDAHTLDVILIPLVAFDLEGNRVGMGGGFYDRTLAFSYRQPYDRRPKFIGLAHEFQFCDTIEPSDWDIPLDGVVTESKATLFSEES